MDMVLSRAGEADLAAINARYAGIDFVPSGPGELMVLATRDGAVCAQGRVVPVDGSSGELGGIYVLPGYQGEGLARRIVEYLVDHAQQPVLYCLPFAELAGLYGAMGFVAVDVAELSEVPGKVREKFQWCQRNYTKAVLLLKRAR